MDNWNMAEVHKIWTHAEKKKLHRDHNQQTGCWQDKVMLVWQ